MNLQVGTMQENIHSLLMFLNNRINVPQSCQTYDQEYEQLYMPHIYYILNSININIYRAKLHLRQCNYYGITNARDCNDIVFYYD